MTINHQNIHLVFAAAALATVAITWVMTSGPGARAAETTTEISAAGSGDAERGGTLYRSRCVGCHSLDANRIGPRHRGVHGRVAGSLDDFSYSPALRDATVVWDDSTLDQWLTNPEAFIPGQRMGFRLRDAEDRHDIIAFLKRESGR